MSLNVIPEPNSIRYRMDGSFDLTELNVKPGEWDGAAAEFIEYIRTVTTIVPTDNHNFFMTTDKSMDAEEYEAIVGMDSIEIRAGGALGIRYALSTLKQIASHRGNFLPAVRINDKPRMQFRGLLIDPGRYFIPVKDVLQLIDLMIDFKLNTLHFHLTEDQGWRVQIDKFPRLTEIGSRRKKTNFNCTPHEGFYSKDDIRKIVSYAGERGIEVMPEIDMPGHMQAAIASYPHLSCFDRNLPVATHWGVKHDILCAGKESTYDFVFAVLDEILELFPSKIIHIGGDEAPKTRWELCPHCRERMAQEGIVNAEKLQVYFVNRVAAYLHSKERKVMMWNEPGASGDYDPNIIVHYYLSENGDIKQKFINQINKNGTLIVSSEQNPYYLDLPYSDNPLREVYSHVPVPSGLNADLLYGMTIPLWGEYIPHLKKMYKMLFPRGAAMAEIMWTVPERCDYKKFFLKLRNYTYGYYASRGVYNMKPVNKANPNAVSGYFERLWFKRRVLHWHGLHNLIDNARVKKMSKKNNK